MKLAVINPLVLDLIEFSHPFTIECDASGKAVGVVLMQKGHPIAYYNQAWRPYHLGSRFTVKTDHQSLKFLLDQKVGTPIRQRWVSKLLGYDFLVDYKLGKENKVVDAISKSHEEAGPVTLILTMVSVPKLELLEELRQLYLDDPKVQVLLWKWGIRSWGLNTATRMVCFYYKQRMYVTHHKTFKLKLLELVHSSPTRGHSRYDKIIHRVKREFFWPRLRLR